ncbi:MAG: S8 family serine peptidase [marine benthic group bacterium]|nr:S8 family serine peptidase [Gemmatimonadota bacterium]
MTRGSFERIRRALCDACRGVATGLSGIALAAAVMPAILSGQEVGPTRDPVAPALGAALQRAVSTDTLSIIIQYAAPAPSPAAPLDHVRRLQVRSANALVRLDSTERRLGSQLRVRERLWVVPAVMADATPAAVAALAADPSVVRIYLDERLPVTLSPLAGAIADPSFTSQAMQTIGADAVWDQGVTGAGTTIAFFDSGVDGSNAMVSSRWRGRSSEIRAAWFDPFTRASTPQDLIGHGTQVAVSSVGALATGDSLKFPDGSVIVASSPVDVVTGPAPGAEWIAARVFERFGGLDYTRRSVLLQAYQWALDPDGNPATQDAPDVINNSWGVFPGGVDFDACNDIIYDAIDAAEAAGIAVLFSSGNLGPAPGSVTPPGARDDPDLRSMAVGATTGVPGNLAVANYSGRGPSQCGGGVKPELVAPGQVPEVRAAGSSAARLTGFAVTGTSFSVAQVSGALALVLQLRPSASPEEAKRILLDTADDLGPGGPDNDSGYGLLNVPAAVQRANAAFAGGMLQASLLRRTRDSLYVSVGNRGSAPWAGGEVWVIPEGRPPVARDLPYLAPGAIERFGLAIDPESGTRTVRVAVTDPSGGIVLSRTLISGPPNLFGGWILEVGDLAAGGNDFGRFGRVAAFRGFEWQGTELLTGGGIAVAGSGRLSDGFYTTTLGRADLKASAPAIETDWAPTRSETDVEPMRAEYRFDDQEALRPLGLEVRAVSQVSEAGGVGALTVVATVRNLSGGRIADATPAFLADWDLDGGETVRWSSEMEALVAESRDGGGAITVLASEGVVVGRTSVPLGTPAPGGAYEPDSGVLWSTFEEADKLDLVTGADASGLPGFSTAIDRAALLSTGPFDLAAGESHTLRFWLLAAQSEAQAAARLRELRDEPIEPPGPDARFEIEPPFPNPLRTGSGRVMNFPYSVPESAREDGLALVFEVYDVAGRRLVRQSQVLTPGGALPRITWDGLLADGLEAASGAYLYVLRLGDENRSGRLVLVH